jgi:gliding motility-associated transport system permease protein/gliding motility-associatede transport system auxiliary component
MTRPHVRLAGAVALGKRDLLRYFGNPTGYIFITLFILLSAAAAFWRPRFFLNNLANLDQLNEMFPYLLLFFVPALCMGLWSDERKQGTDELLLTLPLTDLEVVLGKYMAALGVYTASLVVSLSHAAVLRWLGHPDIGLLTANYLGFWLMGAALIPIAMLGSLPTANATIAFILGSLLCAVPVGLRQAGAAVSDGLARRLAPFGFEIYTSDVSRGIVSLDAALYFACVGGFFVYLNVAVLGRRHWRQDPDTPSMPLHVAARAAAIAIALAAVVVLAGRTHVRADLTAERLYSLGPETRALVAAVQADRPVFVQAFISPDVPQPFVQTRENLLGALREIDAIGGGRVSVAIEETVPYSEQARFAQERFNIPPRTVVDANNGQTHELYFGVAVTSGGQEQVIPFLDRGLSPEYEIARAIRVVSRTGRKRLGIVDTDVKILGGIDYRENRPRPAWAVVQELTKQYEVVEVAPADAAEAPVDALLIVLPTRMTQTDMDPALEPARRGIPTMMLLDPLPMVDIRLAPAADLASEIDPFRPAPASRLVFGNIREALALFGINWVPASIVWDGFNPHPDLADLPQENVFVGYGNGNPDAFNRGNPATAGLQEVLLPYPGYLLPSGSASTFEPLLQTGRGSGTSSFFDVVQPSRNGMVINASLIRVPDERPYVLAAHVRSKQPLSPVPGVRPVNLIVIADLDFVSNYFLDIRASAPDASFDNVTFFLNAIDRLTGDESFIPLRHRRPRHRTLERMELQTRRFIDRRTREEQTAETDARAALDEARARMKQRLQDISDRRDLDEQAKQILVRNVEETESRQLRVLEEGIDQVKSARIRASREAMETQIRQIRTGIRTLAVLLPPVPVLLIGAALFVRRARREREGARASGRYRDIA